MSTEETTNAIDEKVAEEEGTTTEKADWPGFFKSYGNGLVSIIFVGVILIGSVGLFLAKVANANILPTDINLQPYADIERKVQLDVIYMNPVKVLSAYGLGFWAEPIEFWIQEANFVNNIGPLNFMELFKNTWLCSLKEKALPEGKPPSPFWTYEHTVLKEMMCGSFYLIQNIFFYMNYLPEWLTMILFAMFFSVILIIIYIGNFCYSVYAHVIHFFELFTNLTSETFLKKMMMPVPSAPPFDPQRPSVNPMPMPVINPEDLIPPYYTVPFYMFIYFIGALISIWVTPAFITLYTLFKSLSASYYVREHNQSDPPKKQNLISFIKNILYYKKTFILVLAMLKLMSSTNDYLGSSYMPGVTIAILILIFGMNILVSGDASVALFAVANKNVDFPPLKEAPVEGGNFINNCEKEKVNIKSDVEISKIKTITNESANVLSTDTNNTSLKGGLKMQINKFFQTGGKNQTGSKKEKKYNIRLV